MRGTGALARIALRRRALTLPRRCGDATTTWRRFALGLGMSCVAKSDQSTGNATYASYVLRRVRRPGYAAAHAVVRAMRAPAAASGASARAAGRQSA